MPRTEVDVLQGTLDLLVLKALAWGRMHGYSILAWLRQTTDGELRIEDADGRGQDSFVIEFRSA